MSEDFLSHCRQAVGNAFVLTSAGDMAPYLDDWRGRYTGKALAVLRPADTGQVAQLVKACGQWRVPIVPQGGRTGLVMGSVPDQSGSAVVLSLSRMNQVRSIDALNRTMTVDAGCILRQVQDAAALSDCLYPLSMASEGSCSVGGNLSTNAGGTGVLRYGNARELCLGLEVVTAQGEIWNGLRGLRKDNTGYDLRDLYIGAEGTLGVITAAVLKLYPLPRASSTALVALNTPSDALDLLMLAQNRCGAHLTAFELMSDVCLQLVGAHFPGLPKPFSMQYPQYVLLELCSAESGEHATGMLEQMVGIALERGIVLDAAVTTSEAQSRGLWDLREHISMAQAKAGKNIKHDISVPISSIARFIAATDAKLRDAYPGVVLVTFGHMGDGNLHYNVAPPDGVAHDDFLANQQEINRIVHDQVDAFGGAISAEHGIGALKKDELSRYKSPVELGMMRAIKAALDPLGIMNPGKIF